MIDALPEGRNIIHAAESSLRECMKSAVAEGRYEHVTVLARWAEQLAGIIATGRNGGANDAPRLAMARRGASLRVGKSANRKQKKSKYPVFARSGESLVKIAWSKASKSEYHHQAAKQVAPALVEKMRALSNGDELITMESVLPLQLNGQGEVPAYQSYLCLAWLRSIGVVEQHGRRGYSALDAEAAHELIENAWCKLPVQHS
ncbi:MAG: hypothetical protein WCJ41_20075 [Aestuariivirga sp.]|uniref:hypothetical protein n=1 Tax=Aestuariivirga sp. TaxID=2650926 RepID=UPI00301A5ED2